MCQPCRQQQLLPLPQRSQLQLKQAGEPDLQLLLLPCQVLLLLLLLLTFHLPQHCCCCAYLAVRTLQLQLPVQRLAEVLLLLRRLHHRCLQQLAC